MAKTTINLHVSVSSNSLDYFSYMRDNYEKLTSTHDLKWFAHCIDQISVEALQNKVNGTFLAAQGSVGATAHGLTIKSGLTASRLTEGDIDIIADTDTVMLVKGWDDTVVKILEHVDVLGTTFEKIGGFCSGPGSVQMYKDLPTFTWFAMSKRADFSGIETNHRKDRSLSVNTKELSELYNLPVGFELLRDVGWQIPEYLKRNNISYKIMVHEKPTVNAQIVKTGENYHEEYVLDGTPFIAHQRGSMKHRFRVDHLSKTFYDAVDAHVSKLY